jgi:TolB-like protein/Flp pilus assembly protein TadD
LIDAIRETEQPAPGIVPGVPSGTSTVRARAVRPNSRRKWILFAAGFAALAVATLFADRFWLLKHPTAEQPAAVKSAASLTAPTISEKSIAVLPFVDMSEKKDQKYFSDGLSEELIDHLAQNVDLKVIARTSSFVFKGKNEDVRSIATKLGVANLLEGSVRKAGSGLRIAAQLIRASDGVHLWSAIYDRKLSDIFKVQDEISTTVSKALNAALNVSPAVGVQPASPGTTNIEAYNLLLKGNYYFWRGNKGDEAKAVEYIQKALTLEPQYSLAWAKLARTYAWQGFTGELTAADAEVKVRDAVQRALAINPNCAEAYYARGNMLRLIVGDWTAAKSDYESAAALDPHGEMGRSAHGNILYLRVHLSGQFDDRLDWARRALERNPLDTETMLDLAEDQQFSGHLDDSAATFRKLLELNPAYVTAQAQYGLTLLLMGKNLEALAAAEKESDDASKLQALACVYWVMGRRAESDSALGALEQGFTNRDEYEIAAAHACRGEADAAFAWLDRAYRQRKGTLEMFKFDPQFRKLHSDPRFNTLLRRANLVE